MIKVLSHSQLNTGNLSFFFLSLALCSLKVLILVMVKVWATGICIPTHQVRNSLSFISKRLKSVNISHSKITKSWWGLLWSTTIYLFIYFRKRRKPEFSGKQDFDHPIFLALYFFMFPVAGKIIDGSNGDIAADQYHLYPVNRYDLYLTFCCLNPQHGSLVRNTLCT